METLLEALLWLLVISGSFALIGLLAEFVEYCAEEFDAWQKDIFTNYADDGDI